MQVEKDHSSHFRDCMHRLPVHVQAPEWQALATHRREEKHPSKISKLIRPCGFFFFVSRQGPRAKSLREGERKKTNTAKKKQHHIPCQPIPIK